ncbi:hypothetical protein BaRGS_00021803, partial [Batillaria attramentaria]
MVCIRATELSTVLSLCYVLMTNVVRSAASNPCQDGFFLSREGDGTYCRTCAVCPPGHLTTSACTGDRNTTCTPCKAGHFSPGGNVTSCQRCS